MRQHVAQQVRRVYDQRVRREEEYGKHAMVGQEVH